MKKLNHKQWTFASRSSLLLACTSFAIAFVGISQATQLGMSPVKQPLYLLGTAGDEDEIQIMDVPFVTFCSHPEWIFDAICSSFRPPIDRNTQAVHDVRNVNLASLYKISVSGERKVIKALNEQGKEELKVTDDIEAIVDASKAVVPESYPFKVEQVVDAVVSCVKLMFPDKPDEERKLEIKVRLPSGKLIDYSEYSKAKDEEASKNEKSES